MSVFFKLSGIVTTIVMTVAIAIAPSTAIAVAVAVVSSTAPSSGSYTLCQFYSSIPGISSPMHASSMTLPLCPSSLLTFSYTIPPTTATPPSTIAPPSSSNTSSSSWTLCQFYSSISGVPSPTTAEVSSMTLPSCPASLQDITYSYQQAPLATLGGHVPPSTTASAASATPSVTTSTGFVAAAAASSFTGAVAAPRPRLDRMMALGGVVGVGILAGAVEMML